MATTTKAICPRCEEEVPASELEGTEECVDCEAAGADAWAAARVPTEYNFPPMTNPYSDR